MKNIFLLLALLSLTLPAFAQERNLKLVKTPTENPTNQRRKAMVIGMSDYGAGRSLNNTLNDADDMAAVFTRLGFEVTLLKNNDMRNLNANLTAWYKSIESNDMAIFYFAGHGMELDGHNYLIPVDAELDSQTDVKFSTLNVNQVLGNMEEKDVRMKLIILDACRDNPFKRSWNQSRSSSYQGLIGIEAPEGTYIAFAASPGKTAQDGGSYKLNNGVFTHFLKDELLKAGASIDEIFTNVSKGVSNLTNRQQTPFRNSSLLEIFYFIPPNNPTPPTPTPAVIVEDLRRQARNHSMGKRYNEAFTLYMQAADLGDGWSRYMLGYMYFNGQGVAKDYNKAVEYYRKAAEYGNFLAQTDLGMCYQYGYGVIQDYYQAVEWYRKAAENGYKGAQVMLAECYYNGWGVTKDVKQAEEWYRRSNLSEGPR